MRIKLPGRHILLLLLLALATSWGAYAQENAELTGSVTDPTGVL